MIITPGAHAPYTPPLGTAILANIGVAIKQSMVLT